LARLPLKTKTVIVNKLHELALNPDNPDLDIDILKGRKGFRLRVGQYRVIYTRQDDQLIIEVVKIFSPDDSLNACCDHGSGRPSGRPRNSNPATYFPSTPRVRVPAGAR